MNKKNLANAQLAFPVGTADTEWTLQEGQGNLMPTPPFYLTATPLGRLSTLTNSEIVYVTERSGDVLTVQRGQRGTVAHEFYEGDVVANGIYVEDLNSKADRTTLIDALPNNIGSNDQVIKVVDGAVAWDFGGGEGGGVAVQPDPPENTDLLWIDTDEPAPNNTVRTVMEMVYPVGQAYINFTDPTDPAIKLGFGTWERQEDLFILAAGDQFPIDTTGGEAAVKLTKSQLPSIGGQLRVLGWNSAFGNGDFSISNTLYNMASPGSGNQFGALTATMSAGNDQPHNNMPPYRTAYVWERIA